MQPCSVLESEEEGLAMQLSKAISVSRAITDCTSAFCCSANTSSSSCDIPPAPPPARARSRGCSVGRGGGGIEYSSVSEQASKRTRLSRRINPIHGSTDRPTQLRHCPPYAPREGTPVLSKLEAPPASSVKLVVLPAVKS